MQKRVFSVGTIFSLILINIKLKVCLSFFVTLDVSL